MTKKIITFCASIFILIFSFLFLVNSVRAADCSFSCYKGKAYCSATGMQSTNSSNNQSCLDEYEYELENGINSTNPAPVTPTGSPAPTPAVVTPAATNPTVPAASNKIGGQGAAIEQTGKSTASTKDAGLVFGNPLCPAGNNNCVTPQGLIGRVINAVLGLVGTIALVMFIYGGFLWMTSQGNEKQVTTGKNILIWAALGMALIFLSYAMVRFLLTDVIGAK